MEKISINVGSDFAGVGSFIQALKRLKINHNEVFACDWDKYARQTYVLNYGEPQYYPSDVYDRQIPSDSLDIYMTSPPCQSFSLAGKRQGEDSDKGVLFYNSHEFITKNKPRYFIFENVKGLLSDNGGKTFQRWIDFLAGKTVNGNPVIFPHEESVPYHVYYQVMNAKHYGVPQNRERIFIIGIRDDADNEFSFPKPFHLVKRLKDVLECEVDEKYFLSDKMLSYFDTRASNFNNGNINFKDEESIASTITSSSKSLDISDNILKLGYINQDTQASQVFSEQGTSPNICAGTHGYANGYVQIPTNNSKGYDIAQEEEDSINFSNPNSETRRGRVGKGVAQTITTSCEQGILTKINKNEKSALNKNSPFEKLQTMWREIREETFEKWGFRIFTTFQQENILQSRLQGKKYDKSWFNTTNSESGSRDSEKHTEAFYKEGLLREMWKEWEFRCASYRREFPEQQFRKLDGIMSKLSYEYPFYSKSHLQDGELPNKNKSIRILQQTLSEIQDLRESDVCYTPNKERREGYFTQRLGACNQGVLVSNKIQYGKHQQDCVYDINGVMGTIVAGTHGNTAHFTKIITPCNQRIRRLTPTETMRLMDFNPDVIERTIKSGLISDSQLYKQSGNSIVVACLVQIISKLNLK